MSLEKILGKLKVDFLPANKERTREYVKKYELEKYFNDDVSPEYKERFAKGLDKITDEVTDRYSTELRSLVRTPAVKGASAAALLNDISAYAGATPFRNISLLKLYLFGANTIAEVPALARYVKKSKDWYAPLRHYAMRTLRYFTPIVGPMLESGAFERMVKRRVRKEVTRKFIEKYGDYEPIEKRLREKLKEPLKYHVEPAQEREEELVGAEA